MIRKIKLYASLLSMLGSFSLHAQFVTNTGIGLYNSTRITSNGSWASNTGAVLVNDGIISITDDFVNNGTLDNASAGGFVLNFSIDKTFKPGGSSMGFVVKEGNGTALTANTLAIRDSLRLSAGTIHLLNSSDTVSIKRGGIVHASPDAYVEGLVARAGTGDLLFPIGRDGYSLPVKVYKAQVHKATASVMPLPAGYSPGPGVDSLINLPYAWKIAEAVKADTAAYVELSYPDVFPMGANPIVVREIAGLQFASMGARSATTSAGKVTVKSYSRGLTGLFTVANGFQSDPVTDSLALVALYNTTNGTGWTNHTNWLSGPIDTWFGVTQTGQSITALNLPGNKLTGPVPDPLSDILALSTINLSGNSITAIPDFSSNTEVSALNVTNNKLTFTSLEPNASVTGFQYLNQADLGATTRTLVPAGSSFTFTTDAGGNNSTYSWKRNDAIVAGATQASYTVDITRSTMGSYVGEATNSLLPGLVLKTAPQVTLAYASIDGTLYLKSQSPATNGMLTLFRVTTAAYDTVAHQSVKQDGTFSFENVILDDYQLLGFADTVTHPGSLPTYYKNTILWEEADTIKMEGAITGLDIVSERKPTASTGNGSISGYLEEDVPGGRMKKAQRVAGAGVSVRKVENTGRDKEEKLTLVAYVFTDENGEFNLPHLPVGEYRLNIQYPGYPMDETSFVTIPIGTALKSQVSVEAKVSAGKISVRKRVITGSLETASYRMDVYPNPAVDVVRLDFPSTMGDRYITVLDNQGRSMIHSPATAKENTVNVSSLAKGIYFLRVVEKGLVVSTLKMSIE